jgi:glycosyltransferase involved in cell wall biosynthesis
VIYISTFEDLEASPGIRKKIYSQSRWFAYYSGENTHIIFTKNRVAFWQVLTVNKDILFSEKLFDVNGIFEKNRYYKKLISVLPRITAINSARFRVAYVRTVFYDKHFLNLLLVLKKEGFKTVLEIPTSTFMKEYINNFPKGWYKLLNFLLHHKKTYLLADLIVAIGEIPPVLKGLEQKILIIGNGIDLSEIPEITPPEFEKELHLIGVANVAYWHGYDRVIKGLGEYYNHHYNKENGYAVIFHVVGEGPELKKLKELVQKYGLSDKVIFHGTKSGNDLISIYENAHVAIGSLGLHRIKLGGNPIKHREYCAMGIPFVAETNDLDFPDDFPFMLKVSANDSPVNVQQLITFYARIREKYLNYPHVMRKYAECFLTWKAKVQKIMERLI